MKKYALLLLTVITFAACKNTWPDEYKDLFHQACMEEEMVDGVSEAKAKAICDCRTDKVIEKYPDFKEAMENIIEVTNDPELKECEGEAE